MEQLFIKIFHRKFFNHAGSAIIQGIISAGLLGIVGLGAASLSANMSKHYRQVRYREAATNVARIFGSVATNNFLCSTSLRTLGGPLNRTRATYNPPAGAGRDAGILANGQRLQICLPQLTADGVCNSPDEWFPRNPSQPTVVPNTGMQIRDVIFWGATEINSGPLGFQYTNGTLTLVVEPEDTITGVIALRPRTGALNMTIMTNPGRVITGCTAANSPEDFCRQVGGRYDINGPSRVPPQPVCQLMLPEMSCPVGQAMVGLNPGGTPNCVNADTQCPLGHVARNMTMNRAGVQLECEPVGAWDYSDWGPCVGGTTTRTVRCVNAAAMHRWMTTNGFTTFQAAIPPSILINNAYCPAATTPATTGPCTMPPCTVPANTTWTVAGLTCRSTADTIIQDGQTVSVTDALADPDLGDADFSCAGGVATYVAGSGICGPAPLPPPVVACGTWTRTMFGELPGDPGWQFCDATEKATLPSCASLGLPAIGPLTGASCDGTVPKCCGSSAVGNNGGTCSCGLPPAAIDAVWVQNGDGLVAPCPGGYIRTTLEDDGDAVHRFQENSKEGPRQALCIKGITGAYWGAGAACAAGDLNTLIMDDTEADDHKIWEDGHNGGSVVLCLQGLAATRDAGWFPACAAGYYNLGGITAQRNGNGSYDTRNINQDPGASGANWFWCVRP